MSAVIAAPAHRSVYRNRGHWLEHGVCEHCHGDISRLNPSRRHSGAHAVGGYGWFHDETGAYACPPPAAVDVEPEPDLENNGGGVAPLRTWDLGTFDAELVRRQQAELMFP